MDVLYRLQGLEFVWNSAKAASNAVKHGIRFEQACEVFLDPFARALDAGIDDEMRVALIGECEQGHLLFVVHVAYEGGAIRIISARRATSAEGRSYENDV